MFGLIFHWGLYSVPAFDCVLSAKRRRTQNGSEWYLRRPDGEGQLPAYLGLARDPGAPPGTLPRTGL